MQQVRVLIQNGKCDLNVYVSICVFSTLTLLRLSGKPFCHISFLIQVGNQPNEPKTTVAPANSQTHTNTKEKSKEAKTNTDQQAADKT